jgi:MOSC domain
MNDPRMPALLVSHHRPGFYFRVLEEGEVQAGDEIIKLRSGPERMQVAEVACPQAHPRSPDCPPLRGIVRPIQRHLLRARGCCQQDAAGSIERMSLRRMLPPNGSASFATRSGSCRWRLPGFSGVGGQARYHGANRVSDALADRVADDR